MVARAIKVGFFYGWGAGCAAFLCRPRYNMRNMLLIPACIQLYTTVWIIMCFFSVLPRKE